MRSDKIVAKSVYAGWGFEVIAFEAGGKDWQYVRQKPAAGVAVMAVRDDGRVAMIRIRRKTSLFGELITELPRGGMDEGESAQAAAVRELEEETGLGLGRVVDLEYLGKVCPDTGLVSTMVHCFVAMVNYDPGDGDPFERGSSRAIRDRVIDGAGDHDGIWRGRAAAFLGALLDALVVLRDRAELALDAEALGAHLSLEAVLGLADRGDLPARVSGALRNYLAELPGFDAVAAREGHISDRARENHGYLTAPIREGLSHLGGVSDEQAKGNIRTVRWLTVEEINERIWGGGIIDGFTSVALHLKTLWDKR